MVNAVGIKEHLSFIEEKIKNPYYKMKDLKPAFDFIKAHTSDPIFGKIQSELAKRNRCKALNLINACKFEIELMIIETCIC